ncbi:ABC transporter permease [Trueperella sp. LYQ141]|uniref:ABC transporter permease n=1 Tax=Trueperella sp. LYQ141 TaxID=3391058 RepID=UPI0039835D62
MSLLSVWSLFTVGLPLCMYLIFGTGQSYSRIDVGHGNVAATVLVAMAQYGTIVATSMTGASIAVEKTQGWLRTIYLTPLGVNRYISARCVASLFVTMVSIALVYLAALFTDARMEPLVIVQTFLLVTATALLSASLGLLVGLVVRGEEAYSVLGGGTAILGFLSGIFIPLDQMAKPLQVIAQFTPFWGANRLVTCPIYGWEHLEAKSLINVAVWLVLLLLGIRLASRRSTRR